MVSTAPCPDPGSATIQLGPSPGASEDDDLKELHSLLEQKRAALPKATKREPEHIGVRAAKSLDRVNAAANRPPPAQPTPEEKAEAWKQWCETCWSQFIRARGEKYRNCTLDNYDAKTPEQRAVLAEVREHAAKLAAGQKRGQNLIFQGPVGTGKDHLMAALVRVAIDHGAQKVVWKDGVRLAVEFRTAIRQEAEENLIAKLAEAHVLAISDPIPPKGALTDYQASMLFSVIDERCSNYRPTWITLNVKDQEEAEERMAMQIVSRLNDGAKVFLCNWGDYRKPSTVVGIPAGN